MDRVKIPFFFHTIFIFTILTISVGNFKILYTVKGWGWFLPFIYSILIIITSNQKVNFSYKFWLPWGFVVLSYLILSDYSALQRSVQLLSPVIIGMAASTFRFDEVLFDAFIKYCRKLAIILFLVAGIKSGLLITGNLPDITGLAAEVMTATLLCTLFVSQYSLGYHKALYWWLLMSFIPVLALTRTAIVLAGLTLPLNFGPLRISKRIIFILILCLIGSYIFFTPRVQNKMFYSGSGEMSDILSDDFKTTGRSFMWERFNDEIRKKPWFGHGTGAGEVFTRQITGGVVQYPHNDWYLSLYDFGIFGTFIFGFTIFIFSIHLYRCSHLATGNSKCLFITGASSFIPFALFMFTDNIMVYASFFGNLQFALIGLAYGSYQDTDDDANYYSPISETTLE